MPLPLDLTNNYKQINKEKKKNYKQANKKEEHKQTVTTNNQENHHYHHHCRTTFTYVQISPKMVNPGNLGGNAEEKETHF